MSAVVAADGHRVPAGGGTGDADGDGCSRTGGADPHDAHVYQLVAIEIPDAEALSPGEAGRPKRA